MSGMNIPRSDCDFKKGSLPSCAPLAVSVVPKQCQASPKYEPEKALARGTLFPGLDLPLGNIANGTVPDCPVSELMAIDFAAHDLGLYLDTHPEDTEAFDAYRDLLKLCKEARDKYVRKYGPIKQKDLIHADGYTWLNNPWPWDGCCRKEAR